MDLEKMRERWVNEDNCNHEMHDVGTFHLDAFNEGYSAALADLHHPEQTAYFYKIQLDIANANIAQLERTLASPQDGQKISVDVSTDDNDIGSRIFGSLTGETSGDFWLAEANEINSSVPLISVPNDEELALLIDVMPCWNEMRDAGSCDDYEICTKGIAQLIRTLLSKAKSCET